MPEPDRLRSMLSTFVQALMSAEADAVCDPCCGTCSAERTNTRNGYRSRDFDTRAGTVSVRFRSCERAPNFPDWLLERRKRAEMALVSVVATSYLLVCRPRRMEKLVEQLGINRLSSPRCRRR